jgi:hypothetical protein
MIIDHLLAEALDGCGATISFGKLTQLDLRHAAPRSGGHKGSVGSGERWIHLRCRRRNGRVRRPLRLGAANQQERRESQVAENPVHLFLHHAGLPRKLAIIVVLADLDL